MAGKQKKNNNDTIKMCPPMRKAYIEKQIIFWSQKHYV